MVVHRQYRRAQVGSGCEAADAKRGERLAVQGRVSEGVAFQCKKAALDFQSTGIAAEASLGGNDTVTRHDDGNRVAAYGLADGARTAYAEPTGEFAVREKGAVRERAQSRPDAQLERGTLQR